MEERKEEKTEERRVDESKPEGEEVDVCVLPKKSKGHCVNM